MKKTSYLQSSLLLSALQARLQKNSYLSKTVLPSRADAKVFLTIEGLQKIPDRATHPFLYHWFIIMKQFARTTLQKWMEMNDDTQEDELVRDFTLEASPFFSRERQKKGKKTIFEGPFLRLLEESSQNCQKKNVQSPKKGQRHMKSQNYVQFNENINYSHKEIVNQRKRNNIQAIDQQIAAINFPAKNGGQEVNELGLMEIHLNVSRRDYIEIVKQRLQREVEVQRVSTVLEDLSVRAIIKMQGEGHEALKDRISKWPEISNIRFRRQRQQRYDSKSQKRIMALS